MPSDVTLQHYLDAGVTGALVLGLFLGCGLVLAILLILRLMSVMHKNQASLNERHLVIDNATLQAKEEHTKELARLNDYVKSSVAIQDTMQKVLTSNLETLRKIDEQAMRNAAMLDKINTRVMGVADQSAERYVDAIKQVSSYTSTITKQLDQLPIRFRQELNPILVQLETIESALQESQRKTSEIGFLLKNTETNLLKAIEAALIASRNQGNVPLLTEGVG